MRAPTHHDYIGIIARLRLLAPLFTPTRDFAAQIRDYRLEYYVARIAIDEYLAGAPIALCERYNIRRADLRWGIERGIQSIDLLHGILTMMGVPE